MGNEHTSFKRPVPWVLRGRGGIYVPPEVVKVAGGKVCTVEYLSRARVLADVSSTLV